MVLINEAYKDSRAPTVCKYELFAVLHYADSNSHRYGNVLVTCSFY